MKSSIKDILTLLEAAYPEAKTHLNFSNPFELAVSTVLAAQCTDARVNMVMTPLYKTKYKSPKHIINAGLEKFTEDIKSINFYNNKAKAILALCEDLENKFKGKIPDTMEELVSLPGIGRKSANVILANCFNRKDCIIGDTHLIRVTKRLGLTKEEKTEKIEMDLKKQIPEDKQTDFSLRIGEHGREICQAKKPKCDECMFNKICPSSKLFN